MAGAQVRQGGRGAISDTLPPEYSGGRRLLQDFLLEMAVTMDAGRSRFYRGQELTES